MTTTQGRGRGGHGQPGGGFGVYYDPWVFYDVCPEDGQVCRDAHRRHVVGAGELGTGTGALLVLALIAWLVVEADRRVPR